VEAEDVFRQVVERGRRAYGGDHPYTLTSICSQGAVLVTLGRLEEAEPLVEEALEGLRRQSGEDHPSTLSALNGLGNLRREQGRLSEAADCYLAALPRLRRVLGDEHPSTLATLGNVGLVLLAQARPAEAAAHLLDALDGLHRVLGGDHPDTRRMAASIRPAFRIESDAPEALDRLRECVARAEETRADSWTSYYAEMLLGSALMERSEFAAAEPWLLAGHAGLGRPEFSIAASDRAILVEATEQLAALYAAWDIAEPDAGHGARAVRWREEWEALRAGADAASGDGGPR
jgi:tetratricopeptide (TPR) repeat protein